MEDGRLDIEGLSATSAGSMNAIVLAQGMLHNDRDEARQALHDFWHTISEYHQNIPFKDLLETSFYTHPKFSLDNTPFYTWFEFITHIFSPYQFNPMNLNPLKDVLEKMIDFETIKKRSKIKLFICATNVHTGKVKIFSKDELSINAILASACLPTVFQAVEVDGQHYWDGGYIGNPAIYPLIYNCNSKDIVIIHLNPIYRKDIPTTSGEILNRINEISFNSSLMREMRAIAFVTGLIDSKKAKGLDLKRMFIHSIRSDEEMSQHDVSTKLNANWDFFTYLYKRGRHYARLWIKETYDKIGKESSIDIRKEFL